MSKPCPQQCPNLQPCPLHPSGPYANARRSTTLYNTARWRRESKAFLAAHPGCCEVVRAQPWDSRPTSSTMLILCNQGANTVDHITPHRGNEVLFWDRSNWQPMCGQHHRAKTGREVGARR